jgi:hypothetical protein
MARAVARDARVPGRRVELEPRILAQLPRKGVLAPSRADQQDSHRATLLAASAGLKLPAGEQDWPMSMHDPGLDQYDWASQLEGLDEDLHSDPVAALPELADLVERILGEAGYDIADPVVRDGEEREVVAEYLAAREISDLVERANDQLSPGDVAQAIAGLRAVAQFLINERSLD